MSRAHTRLLRREVNAPRIENAKAARQWEEDMRRDLYASMQREHERQMEDEHQRLMAEAYGAVY